MMFISGKKTTVEELLLSFDVIPSEITLYDSEIPDEQPNINKICVGMYGEICCDYGNYTVTDFVYHSLGNKLEIWVKKTKITNRLEKLKAEKEIIQNMKCLSFELRDKCLAWYEHEIECIERSKENE